MVSTLNGNGKRAFAHASPAFLEKLRGLPEDLRRHIRGQDHVIERVCSVLKRGELGFAHPRRPKGSFLFVGPTGVGKTELTNVFTGLLFDGAKPVRFDMSEYQNQSSVEKLIGNDSGIGSSGGLLGRALAGADSGTLLFDEIEKAHPLLLDLFLQMLEDATITLATGERKNLGLFYVVFTSNIGSREAMRMERAPLASIERTVLARVSQELRPELVGRITEKLVFLRLDFGVKRAVCEEMIAGELARLRSLGHEIELDSSAVEFLVRRGYHKTLGARPMRSAVEKHLQEVVAESILAGGEGCGRIMADLRRDTLLLRD